MGLVGTQVPGTHDWAHVSRHCFAHQALGLQPGAHFLTSSPTRQPRPEQVGVFPGLLLLNRAVQGCDPQS